MPLTEEFYNLFYVNKFISLLFCGKTMVLKTTYVKYIMPSLI